MAVLLLVGSSDAATTEFCLVGEFDLAARMQGLRPRPGEWTPASWCVTTDADTARVRFEASGKSNPDVGGDWTVAFVPPDLVRIVNSESPPDVEFRGAPATEEAARYRRIDPRRLVEEVLNSSAWTYDATSGIAELPAAGHAAGMQVSVVDERIARIETMADLPLRGRTQVTWNWRWLDIDTPVVAIDVGGQPLFRGHGAWRELDADDAARAWQPTPAAEPVPAPPDSWPSRINMQKIVIGPDTWLVRGVRTGFQHLVVDTADGLVVADAPAGWVEIQQLPPVDLVPGMGISGLSEEFVDYLEAEFPGRPIHAVVLTHAHDDHAGGARAFAAAGARVYAPAEVTPFLSRALNAESMPPDSLRSTRRVGLFAVSGRVAVSDRVEVTSIGANPHVSAALGVAVPDAGIFFVSDLHVPTSQLAIPRADRVPTECWFAAWAVDNLPPGTRVVNSHSAPTTPVARLARYLDDPDCVALAGGPQ
jgi:glyoxylase-like metal-dependent hydrolase (beta-lactamase superfamily II)